MSTEPKFDNFAQPKPNRRLGLKIGQQIFYVSREGLAELSPVFMQMFYGEFDESKKDIVELKNKKSRRNFTIITSSISDRKRRI